MLQSPEHFSSAIGDTATEAAPVMAVKIGVDTGGTFSDFMLMDGDTLVAVESCEPSRERV